MTVEELNIIIRASGQTSYNTAMRSVTRSTQGFESSVGKLTSTLARFVSAGYILKLSKECVTAASDLQEVANVMNVTFGEGTAGIINDWAKSQAASFGLSETSAKRYIGTYGTMAKQFGYTAEQAANMGIELAKLTGDVASFYNIDDKLASIKLKSVFTGETETLKELGVVMTEANLNNYALEKGLGKTVKQMNEHEKVALRYSFVLDKLSHTQGDFANTSDSWANSTRIFKLQLENLKVEIGNQLLPVASYALGNISKGISAIAPYLVYTAQTVHIYVEAWKRASDTTKNFLKIGLSVFALGMLAPKVCTLVHNAYKVLFIDTLTLGTALKALLGIAGIVLAGVALKKLFEEVEKIKEEQKDSTKELEALADTSAVASDAVDGLADSMDGLGDATKELESFLAPFDEVNKINGSDSIMSNLLNSDDLANIMAATAGLGDMNSIIDEISNSTFDGLSTSTDEISAGFERALETANEYIEAFKKGFKDAVRQILILQGFARDVNKWTKPEEAYNSGLAIKQQKARNDLEAYASGSTGGEGKTYTDMRDFIKDARKANSGSYNYIADVVKSLQKANSGNYNYIADDVKTIADVVKDLQNSRQKASSYSMAEYHAPSIGGFVSAPSAPAAPAANLEQLKKVFSPNIEVKAPEVKVEVNPKIEIDGRQLANTVVSQVNTQTRSSGRSPFVIG